MSSHIYILDALAALSLAYVVRRLLLQRRNPPPPGPKRLPLIGNLLDMPTSHEWLTFAEWGKQWGDITSISVLGQEIVIVNSLAIAIDMLEKKSAVYSDRPVMPMGGELVGWKNTLVLTPYSDRFRTFRRLFHQVIGSNSAMARFQPVEEEESQRFLQFLLKQPEDLATHIRRAAGAIILRISHGYKIQEKDDPFITIADEATEQFSLATAPGGFLVNLVPALQYVPEWVPGAGFQKTAREWRSTLNRMVDGPHQFVKEHMANGTAEPSFTLSLLEESKETDVDIKWAAASLYSGGSDTTVASIYAFFLAMTLFPSVQERARAELDAVVGQDRLPTFADRERLPYINAVTLEALRWHTVVPTGVPHRVSEDDVFQGYFIPKGALVITNIWFMLHDPRVYSDPMEFKPERFMGPSPEPDPRSICFGFGRRICPGKVLAESSVFIAVAHVLATFTISKVVEDGVVIEPSVAQTSGTISHPMPFRCKITPRSENTATLINGL